MLTIALLILITAVNAVLLIATYRETVVVHEEVQSIRASRGRIVANEASIEAVSERLRKLSGRVYKELASRDEEVTIEPVPETQQDAFACDNWMRAQIDGPLSAAAKCECAYCEQRRAARRDLRKTLGTNHLQAVKSIEQAS